MAVVMGKVHGGTLVKGITATTVADVVAALNLEGNYTAVVDGEIAELTDTLVDGNFISLAKAVKGGVKKVIVETDNIVIVRDGKDYFVNGNKVTRAELKKVLNQLGDFFGFLKLV